MYWIGSYDDIVAAEESASSLVVGLPEYVDGVKLPKSKWVTKKWADPIQTVSGGIWAIPLHPDMELPDGCDVVDKIEYDLT